MLFKVSLTNFIINELAVSSLLNHLFSRFIGTKVQVHSNFFFHFCDGKCSL
jgi:hypothetical protein